MASQRLVSLSHDPSRDKPLHLVAADGQSLTPPGETSPAPSNQLWVELLREGLTFDLVGLAPKTSPEFPRPDFRFDVEFLPGPASYEALHLFPGKHLASSTRSEPVTRALIALARDFIHFFDSLEMVVWPPSRSAIGRRFFESVTTAWLDGGPFPGLGLTAFKETGDGALQSVGLDLWIGQELRIEPPLSSDKVQATRLGVRLVNQLVILGGIEGSERSVGPDGSMLVLRSSRNGKFVRVTRE